MNTLRVISFFLPVAVQHVNHWKQRMEQSPPPESPTSISTSPLLHQMSCFLRDQYSFLNPANCVLFVSCTPNMPTRHPVSTKQNGCFSVWWVHYSPAPCSTAANTLEHLLLPAGVFVHVAMFVFFFYVYLFFCVCAEGYVSPRWEQDERLMWITNCCLPPKWPQIVTQRTDDKLCLPFTHSQTKRHQYWKVKWVTAACLTQYVYTYIYIYEREFLKSNKEKYVQLLEVMINKNMTNESVNTKTSIH